MPVHILPVAIQRLIAAGEVIERPASVAKELVENAIDAQASAISVEIRDGGLGQIRVSDDGHGMSRDDAALSLARFSTSKIGTLDDLEQIRTLGFRGEALSSIAAVAQIDILTRTQGELAGTRVLVRGDTTTAEPAASPVGTSVTVNALFGQLPVRRRFLKSRTREVELTQQTVTRYALAYPHIAFRLVVDGRERLVAPQDTPLARIGAVLNRDVAGEMVPIEWQALDLRVQGFISRPTIGRSRRSDQYFFVNGRPVRPGLLAVMLERPYAGRLPPGRYPLCVIHITIAPHHVDVNVHPQKADIRFSQERTVYSAVSSAVRDALSAFPQQAQWADQPDMTWPFAGTSTASSIGEPQTSYKTSEMRVLAQLHNTYVLAQTDDGLIVADQHAAHEQLLFEQLVRGSKPVPLSPPVRLGLTPREMETMERIAPALNELGIEIEDFGRQNVLVRSLPANLQSQDVAKLVTALIEHPVSRSSTADELRDSLAAKAACLGAVKAGDPLTVEQMQQLLDDLAQVWSPVTCPHGRPALVTVSIDELDRRFNRT
ncbi:MAG: DNA mismatch repair endonuclease MutL [Anaerolineae bacterium]|nr:DNA mismatch repair endonuclease MutL [Anaerolineae bacterium]